jgi:hypothetical protein
MFNDDHGWLAVLTALIQLIIAVINYIGRGGCG